VEGWVRCPLCIDDSLERSANLLAPSRSYSFPTAPVRDSGDTSRPLACWPQVLRANPADHLPLYRQEAIFGPGRARADTLHAGRMDPCLRLQSLVEALRAQMLSCAIVRADASSRRREDSPSLRPRRPHLESRGTCKDRVHVRNRWTQWDARGLRPGAGTAQMRRLACWRNATSRRFTRLSSPCSKIKGS
jgi:hypothetical protein